jgi:hypothetical protein
MAQQKMLPKRLIGGKEMLRLVPIYIYRRYTDDSANEKNTFSPGITNPILLDFKQLIHGCV